jgi:large subunit ribosomal protein L6
MSRIGKQPIAVPAGVDVSVDGRDVTVKGPKGTLSHQIAGALVLDREDDTLRVVRADEERRTRELHGLTRTLIANMVTGVTQGYEKRLEIVGTGYRVVAKGANLEFALGYSHSITVEPPAGVTFTVEAPTRLVVTGIDKQQVGEVAANLRKLRKPDPYKGKGVRYAGEQIKRKVGKAGKK